MVLSVLSSLFPQTHAQVFLFFHLVEVYSCVVRKKGRAGARGPDSKRMESRGLGFNFSDLRRKSWGAGGASHRGNELKSFVKTQSEVDVQKEQRSNKERCHFTVEGLVS